MAAGRQSQKPKKAPYKAPQFIHLPTDKARKLKQEWIAKQKIKNAYRAQKRKGSIPVDSSALQVNDDQESDALEHNESTTEHIPPKAEQASSQTKTNKRPPPSEILHNSPPNLRQPVAKASSKATVDLNSEQSRTSNPHPLRKNRKSKAANSNNHPVGPQAAEKPSEENVRELVRDAYSRSSLHTFKSDPLHRRAHNSFERGIGGSRGRDQVTSRAGSGRGQPDMRKRMGALLAQIKSGTQ